MKSLQPIDLNKQLLLFIAQFCCVAGIAGKSGNIYLIMHVT